MELKDKKRYGYMDLIRMIAIVLVVLNHATHSSWNYYSSPSSAFMAENFVNRIAQCGLHTLSRVGVPLFLCLTGALLLTRKYEDGSDVKRFYKHNFMPLLVVVEIWNCLYYLMYCLLNHTFDLMDLVRQLLFIDSSWMGHMWYMPMILGLYLVIPFLASVLQKFSARDFILPYAVCFVYSFIFPSIYYVMFNLDS